MNAALEERTAEMRALVTGLLAAPVPEQGNVSVKSGSPARVIRTGRKE